MKKDITHEWQDDLMMCPSQCYSSFEYLGKYYCIYLRWRWDDPWTATLCILSNKDMNMWNADWRDLNVNYYTHDNLGLLKEEAIEKSYALINELNK